MNSYNFPMISYDFPMIFPIKLPSNLLASGFGRQAIPEKALRFLLKTWFGTLTNIRAQKKTTVLTNLQLKGVSRGK